MKKIKLILILLCVFCLTGCLFEVKKSNSSDLSEELSTNLLKSDDNLEEIALVMVEDVLSDSKFINAKVMANTIIEFGSNVI